MPWIVERPGKKGTYYYVRASINGKKTWRSFGRSEAKAKRALTDLERAIANDDLPRRSDWTLDNLEELYLDRMQNIRPRSDRWRREMFATLKRKLGGDCLLESVTLETVDRYASDRLKEGRAPSTVLGEVHVLRHALKQAFRWREATGLSQYRVGEWQPIERGSGEERVKPLPTKQAEAVIAATRILEKGASAHVREGCLLTRLFLGTGARPVEMLAAKKEDLDPKTRSLRLPGFKRGTKWRFVELSDDLAADLLRMARDRGASEPLFPPLDSLPKDRYKGVWAKIRKKAGVSCRFYDLRHTFSVEFLARGGELRDLQYRLGHKSIRTTEKHYARFLPGYRPPPVLLWRGARNGAPGRQKRAGRAERAERKSSKTRRLRRGRTPRA